MKEIKNKIERQVGLLLIFLMFVAIVYMFANVPKWLVIIIFGLGTITILWYLYDYLNKYFSLKKEEIDVIKQRNE